MLDCLPSLLGLAEPKELGNVKIIEWIVGSGFYEGAKMTRYFTACHRAMQYPLPRGCACSAYHCGVNMPAFSQRRAVCRGGDDDGTR